MRWPSWTRFALLVLGGMACLGFGLLQLRYQQLVTSGNQAVAAQRFDTQAYERARRFWFANSEALRFNQGVLAFRAKNYARAAEHFRQVAQQTGNRTLKARALYNLGRVMLELDEVEGAAELFKEALRLDPADREAKFNLERLYHFVLLKEEHYGEATLQQAPGVRDEKHSTGEGQGRSKPRPDI